MTDIIAHAADETTAALPQNTTFLRQEAYPVGVFYQRGAADADQQEQQRISGTDEQYFIGQSTEEAGGKKQRQHDGRRRSGNEPTARLCEIEIPANDRGEGEGENAKRDGDGS